jgi:dipeptidyl aminopeptidase/acylaminoacyl peptidase
VTLAAVLLAGAALAAAQAAANQRQVGQLVLDGVPEIDPAVMERMLQYQNVRPTGLGNLSEDGKAVLISTRFGNTSQLHLVSTPLGMRRQLTFFDEPVSSGRFIPGTGGQQVLFGKDRGGDERTQFYRLNLQSGRWALLTDGKARHTPPALSRSGKWLAFSGTARNDKDFDLYLLDLAAGEAKPKLAWQVEGQYYAGPFSPDESKLLVQRYLSERQTEWYVFDVASGKQMLITAGEPAYYGAADWSYDGKSLFIVSDREGEFRKLYTLNFEYGQWKCLTPDIEWDVEEIAVERNGDGVAFVVNEDGISKLYFDDGSGRRRTFDALPHGVISGLEFSDRGGVLGMAVNSARAPSDVYTVTVADGKVTRWTASEIGGLNPETFVEPELIRYQTFDNAPDGRPRQIPAFYYRGKGAGPRPVIIYCHGGPEGQTQPTFVSTFQYWAVELGISILCPNVRGSVGYGKSFHQLDNGVKREDSVRDVGALLDWIAMQPELDAKRVGIYGGSYGGYMVLAGLTTYPERFKAGIDVVGIASFISFLETTPEFRRDLRRAEYGDERQPDVRKVLETISPLNNAHKIQAALFVVHGKNDARVPFTEAEQIVKKVRELGRPVWYALALDEGHGFQKKNNRDLANALYAMFWQKHLIE